MSEIEKFDLSSKNIADEKKERLKELFPEVFTDEGKIDCRQLQLTLGEDIDVGKERYGMNWPGKADCFKVIQKPSIATLLPFREESVDFDDTENLFIEGDNLEVLKLLQKSYFGKVKMIYIDPPYNTGNDFIYPDDYTETLDTYLRYTGQLDDDGRRFSTNTETSGRFHSKWMSMIYPRLFLARNLLREDGVIFISIDDEEVDNLLKVGKEIFGEENLIATLPTIMNLKGNNDQFGFAGTHEYTVVFAKSIDLVLLNEFPIDQEELFDWDEDDYGPFKKGANLKATGGNAPREKRPNLFFPIYISDDDKLFLEKQKDKDIELLPITDGREMSWRWSKEKIENEKHNIIIERNKSLFSIYKKQRPSLGNLPSKKPKSTFYKPVYSSGNGTEQLKKLFTTRVFNNPKPLDLIKDFIIIGSKKDRIIIDFLAGSCTAAHATIELNKEDGGNRKFIMVQLPEECHENSEAFKAGYKTIADIGKERIRRVIKKIKTEKETSLDFKDSKQDLGFKVFKLQSSNFNIWNADTEKNEEEIKEQIELHIEHINPNRKEEDILYELVLKSGYTLSTKIEKLKIAGKTVFSIENGILLICLEKELTLDLMRKIAEKEPERFVCLDMGFQNNDQLKTNAAQIMKSKDITFRTV